MHLEAIRKAMNTLNEGLTKIYNRIHNPDDCNSTIEELRCLEVLLDTAVLNAYGWNDIDFEHGFHDTIQGRRYTMSEAARLEILDRLLELNHQRHEEDAAQFQQNKAQTQSNAKRGRRSKVNSAVDLGRLFDELNE